jgi:crotonobetainyl-CoA:carnitine CoA-transferase CaiB-like acyl-CoA transferase
MSLVQNNLVCIKLTCIDLLVYHSYKDMSDFKLIYYFPLTEHTAMSQTEHLPLSHIKVVEFSHMVMGPSASAILADLGADVIKIEPIGGDNTRRLRGSGAGYFAMYNRNKRSICIDLKSKRGNRLAKQLITGADVLIENFRPGAMDKLGFGYADLAEDNEQLIYCSTRGFLNGPYEHRTALDEVAQMMGGLAFMTGLPNRPMRAGASVIDVMGGMFGVIAILAAIEMRQLTGKGQQVTSSLFESTVFLMGQHMAQQVVMGEPAKPMSIRTSAWAIYDIFNTKDNQQVFVAVVSDTQWVVFCEEFELTEFSKDVSLKANNDRVNHRDTILPAVQKIFLTLDKSELMDRLEKCGLPFAGVGSPSDLFSDPHLLESGGLLDITVPNGETTKLPGLPIQMSGKRFDIRKDVPLQGEHTIEILESAGFTDKEIAELIQDGIIEDLNASS